MTPPSPTAMRRHAESIWRAGVEAVRPQKLIGDALARPDLRALLAAAQRIIVVGAGKAGAAMAEGVEAALASELHRISGWVNVPANVVRPLRRIHLHAARPAGHNHPTAEGVAGSEQILRLVAEGMSNKEVGRKLSLQEKTVKHYMTRILEKLHVRNRTEAAILLREVTRPQ